MKDLLFAPRLWTSVLCGAAALLLSAGAYADPPDRVARLTQIQGAVSFSPAGEEDWAIADANRPVTTGDRVWADADSHVELQLGDAAARLGSNTAVTVLNLDDRIGQFQLAQGTLNVRVRQISNDQFYEVDTPTLAFSIRRAGDYRVDVDPSGNTTILQVRAGQGEAWGEGTSYVIDQGQQYTFTGEGMRDYRYDPLPAPDAFDRWALDRNRREDAAIASASRYVSPQVVGYSDLDEYGTWRNVENYGTVWVPTRVEADWAPYHYGRWGWVEPWGWTWIDDAPWGFAPFHYGRWAYLSNHWCWVPGPVRARPVYAPALVAFVGGSGFSIAVGGGPVSGVAWFPLGVGEVYRPSYEVSRTYFTNVNVTNTVVNNTYVTNVYNNQNVDIHYRNREVAGAVTAVPANAFASGDRVERHAVRVQQDVVARGQVEAVPSIAPTRTALLAAGAAAAGAAAVAAHRPPRAALERQVVARTEPAPQKPSFAQRSQLLSSQPGRPLDTEKMRSVRAERSAETPRVKVVAPSGTPRPIEAAKGGPQGGPTAQEERGTKDRRGRPEAGGPQANVPQPPAAAQDRFRGGPQGPTAQEEGATKDRRGRPEAAGPQANVPQPPAAAQDRFRGAPQGQSAAQERAQQERAAQQGKAQQDRAQQERAAQQGKAQQDRAQQERAAQQGKAQQDRAQQERAAQQGKAQQDRAQQERAAQQGKAQQDRAQQERAQQERNQQQERSKQERAQQDQRSQVQQQQRAQAQAQQRAQQERAQAQAQQQQRAQQERAQAQAQQRAQAQAQQRPQQQPTQEQAQRSQADRGRAQAQQEKEKEKEQQQRGG